MRLGNIYKYMYGENSPKLKYLGKEKKQYRFKNLNEQTIELLPKAALQGLVEVRN